MTDTPPVQNPAPEPSRAISPVEQFKGTLVAMESKFVDMLPAQISPKKLIGTIMTAVNLQPALLETDRRSLLVSCMKAAQDGLLPDGREAAFVIFGGKDGKKTQYMPMVGGLLKKLRNSGQLVSISSHVVYAADEFTYELGDNESITHKPAFGVERGNPTAVYATAKTKDGAIYREVMSYAEVEKVRSVSRAKDSGPWVQWWGEMAKKTVIRRLCKRLPSSADLEQVLRHDDETNDFSQQTQAPRPSGALSRLKGAMGITVEAAQPEQEPILDAEAELKADAGTAADPE